MTHAKKVTCIIDNTDWYRAYESAQLWVKSPTGQSIAIMKSRLKKINADPELVDAVSLAWKLGEASRNNKLEYSLTIKQMNNFLKLSKL